MSALPDHPATLTVAGFVLVHEPGKLLTVSIEADLPDGSGSAPVPLELETGPERALVEALFAGIMRQARELEELRAAFSHEHGRVQRILSGWLEATSPVLAAEVGRELSRARGAPEPEPESAPEEIMRQAAEEHARAQVPDAYMRAGQGVQDGQDGELVADPEPHRFVRADRYGRTCAVCGLDPGDPAHEVPEHPLERGT